MFFICFMCDQNGMAGNVVDSSGDGGGGSDSDVCILEWVNL